MFQHLIVICCCFQLFLLCFSNLFCDVLLSWCLYAGPLLQHRERTLIICSAIGTRLAYWYKSWNCHSVSSMYRYLFHAPIHTHTKSLFTSSDGWQRIMLQRFIKYQLHVSPVRTERTAANVFSAPSLELFFGSIWHSNHLNMKC